MKGLSLSLITVVMLAGSLAIDAQTNHPSLVVVCDGGSTKGIFTQVGPDGYETGEDRSTLDRIIYAFDAPREGAVRITYGEKEVIGLILKNYPTYRTVVYQYGGVPLMDTIFLEFDKVLSTDHKDSFGFGVATIWRLDCSTSS